MLSYVPVNTDLREGKAAVINGSCTAYYRVSKHRPFSSIVTIVTKYWELSAQQYLSLRVLSEIKEEIILPFSQPFTLFLFILWDWVLFFFSPSLWGYFFPLAVLTISAHPERVLSWESSQSKQGFVSHYAFSPSWETADPHRPKVRMYPGLGTVLLSSLLLVLLQLPAFHCCGVCLFFSPDFYKSA